MGAGIFSWGLIRVWTCYLPHRRPRWSEHWWLLVLLAAEAQKAKVVTKVWPDGNPFNNKGIKTPRSWSGDLQCSRVTDFSFSLIPVACELGLACPGICNRGWSHRTLCPANSELDCLKQATNKHKSNRQASFLLRGAYGGVNVNLRQERKLRERGVASVLHREEGCSHLCVTEYPIRCPGDF